MNFYQEITLIDHAEISPYFIWSRVYGQIHIAFAEHKDANNKVSFGLSFPQYYVSEDDKKGHLGKKLRIFSATKDGLEKLNLPKWLVRLTDYVHITSIREVPKNIQGYATYQRKQYKGASRIEKDMDEHARYYAKNHNVSYEEAFKRYEGKQVEVTFLPFIQMKSLTTAQCFKLFIEKKQHDHASETNYFTTYGLSSESTVPEF